MRLIDFYVATDIENTSQKSINFVYQPMNNLRKWCFFQRHTQLTSKERTIQKNPNGLSQSRKYTLYLLKYLKASIQKCGSRWLTDLKSIVLICFDGELWVYKDHLLVPNSADIPRTLGPCLCYSPARNQATQCITPGDQHCNTFWWLSHPSEKYESQLGWWTSQYMEKKMFQTTNQNRSLKYSGWYPLVIC